MGELEANGDVLTHYEEAGSGPPLVLVHGLGGSVETWRGLVGPLARDFRVIAYDLRGAGRSAVPPGPYTVDELVEDLDGVIRRLELEPVLLMGHSLGGGVALAYAARHPERVLGVVGLGAVSSLPEQGREGMRARAEAVEEGGMEAVAETVATNGTAPSFRERDPDGFRRLVEMLESCPPEGYAALCRAVAGLDVTAELERISAPVLLIGGDRDVPSPPEANEAAAGQIPDARYVRLDDTAHNLLLERPEEVLAAARPFLHEAAGARV